MTSVDEPKAKAKPDGLSQRKRGPSSSSGTVDGQQSVSIVARSGHAKVESVKQPLSSSLLPANNGPSITVPPPADSAKLFQLPDETTERLFLFQNSCEDRSDVLLTNMNSAMTEEEAEASDDSVGQNMYEGVDTDRILDSLNDESVFKTPVKRVTDIKDSHDMPPEGLSPATKAKSLSSPDLIRSEADFDEWESEEQLEVDGERLLLSTSSRAWPATTTENSHHQQSKSTGGSLRDVDNS